MKPPPPILPAAGSTTARAKAVATAASTALPPCFRISTPACDPSSSSVTTMPCTARTACLGQVLFGSDCTTSLEELCPTAHGARAAAQTRNKEQRTPIVFLREVMAEKH